MFSHFSPIHLINLSIDYNDFFISVNRIYKTIWNFSNITLIMILYLLRHYVRINMRFFTEMVKVMFENIENLKIISSLHRENRQFSKIENKKTNSFFIRISGSITYNFYDKTVEVKPGEMMFIPKGTSYEYKTSSEEKCLYTSINFEGDFEDAKPKVYSLENFFEADYIKNHFTDLWKYGTQSDKFKCISLFYSLLSYVSHIENSSYAEKQKFRIIEPAIDYLKEHIFDYSLKTDYLHHLCGISGTYFRKIFLSRFGRSPQNYITTKRMAHAMSILDSGDFTSIKEVALSVGYSDPLYFSKIFKKMYGVSPSEIS